MNDEDKRAAKTIAVGVAAGAAVGGGIALLSSALGEAVAVAPFVLAGAAVGGGAGYRVERRRRVLSKLPTWLRAPATSYKQAHAIIPKLGGMSQPTRLEAILTSWMALTDAMAKAWPNSLQDARRPIETGEVLWNIDDLWAPKIGNTGIPNFLSATTAKERWSSGQEAAVIAEAEEHLKRTVKGAANLERQTGKPLMGEGGEEVSLLDAAEDYATDAAITYLVSMVPGAGTVAALASAAGVGWGFTSGRQTVPAAEWQNELQTGRRVAFSRALDLIRHAEKL